MTIRISFLDKTVRVAVEINGAIESAITELPQRPWVGLTDDEREKIKAATMDLHGIAKFFATAIEAKLKEKNR